MGTEKESWNGSRTLTSRQKVFAGLGGVALLIGSIGVLLDLIIMPIQSGSPVWLHVAVGAAYIVATGLAAAYHTRRTFFGGKTPNSSPSVPQRLADARRVLVTLLAVGVGLLFLHEWMHGALGRR